MLGNYSNCHNKDFSTYNTISVISRHIHMKYKLSTVLSVSKYELKSNYFLKLETLKNVTFSFVNLVAIKY